MSADNISLGPDAKVRINSTVFAVVDGSIRYVADVPESTDSESAPYKHAKDGGLVQLEISLTVHNATDVSIHTAPLLIVPRTACTISVYPKGLAYEPYSAASFMVESVETSFRVSGSEPQTVRISGRTNGEFSVPGT